MSVQNRTSGISGTGYLSDGNRNEDGLLIVHGIALGNNDITIGAKSGERKLWRPEVLEESAEFLEGKDIVVNHENQDAYQKVGEITDTKYDEDRGIIYQGVVKDDSLEEKIELGWLDVSPKLLHSEEYDEVSDGVKAPVKIHDFPNLSIVRKGASPSNELQAGEHPELSIEELQASFEENIEGVQEYHFRSEEEELQSPPDGVDFARWMFDDREAAEGAAEAFPCEGTHKRTVEGDEWYLPCGSHDKFLEAIKEKQEEEDDLEESMNEDDEPDGTDEELAYTKDEYEYSKEEKKLASQMSSYSELTQSECLGLLASMNPDRHNDVDAMSKMVSKALGMHGDEMKRILDEMSGHKEKYAMKESLEKYLDEENSLLNEIFS